MSDKEIDDILKSQRNAPDPALLAGITASIASKTVPVRPLPSSSMLGAGLLSICAIVPSIIAAILGFQGVRQLGTASAAFTSLGCWFILRRGFAANPAMAGLATGTLAGLAGVIALELHCPIFAVMHVTVWHTAVIPVSACLGATTSFILARK
jgi:hypothetical protein